MEIRPAAGTKRARHHPARRPRQSTPASSEYQRLVDRPIARKRTLLLDPAAIHPVLRIAHRIRGPINTHERIIFDHELVLLLHGRGRATMGNQRVELGPGSLLLVRPFQPHRIVAGAEPDDEVPEHIAVHFDPAPTCPPPSPRLNRRPAYAVRLPRGLRWPRHVALPASHPIVQDLAATVAAWETDGPLSEAMASSRVLQVLLTLLTLPRRSEESGSIDARNRVRLQRAMDWLDQHLAQPLSAADLAHAAGLSAPHFNRLFRQWTGQSPMAYLRRRRIDAARRLLMDVDLSIKEVAGRVGFDSPYHFSRTFRAVDGLAPSDYRAAVLTRGVNATSE